MNKNLRKIDVNSYRSDPFYKRNQEIWRCRFNKNWTLKKIALHFQLSLDEIRDSIKKHKQFYKQEYD